MNGLRFTDDDRLLAGKSRDGHRHDDPMIVIAADSAAASAPSSGYGQLVLFLLCRHTQAGKTIRHGGKTVALLDAQSRRVIETAGALCTGCGYRQHRNHVWNIPAVRFQRLQSQTASFAVFFRRLNDQIRILADHLSAEPLNDIRSLPVALNAVTPQTGDLQFRTAGSSRQPERSLGIVSLHRDIRSLVSLISGTRKPYSVSSTRTPKSLSICCVSAI